MSNYKLARYPRDKYRFRLFDNIFRYPTAAEVLAAHPGAVGCINLGYFALTDIPEAGAKAFDHQCAVMICGGWVRSPEWPWPGMCIDADGYATVGYDRDAKYDYIASVQADYINGKRDSTKPWARNGVTYTGWLPDGTLLSLLASADDGLTGAEAVQILLAEGCVSILRWDGSWSSQGQLLPGVTVKPSIRRTVRTWLIIYPREGQKEEDKPVTEQQIRANIVSIAKAFVGATLGSSAHKDIIDTYNTIKPLPRGYKVTCTDSWCAAFVSAIAVKAGLTDIIPPECSCNAMIQLFQRLGRWQEDDRITPQVGDILFYDWDDNGQGDNRGAADHVGIVSAVTGSTITVIEGNYSKAVRERKIAVNGRYIRGYGLPFYASKADKPAPPAEDYRATVKSRYGLADDTVDYLAAYKYGPDLLRKLATQG